MKIRIIILIVSTLAIYSCSNKVKESEAKVQSENEISVAEIHDSISFPEKGSFPSSDGILIQADIYQINDTAPVILLCHQARYNKTEYSEIAPKLNDLGFNCIAIDQRSGGKLNDSLNITHERALKKKLPVDYLDAEKDIVSAIDFAYNKYGKLIILWGSSYSSTLALYQGISNDKVFAVVAFSPGDYFSPDKESLKVLLKDFSKPFFITSSRDESSDLTGLLSDLKKDKIHVQFIPSGDGKHGSSALHESQPDHEEYWRAVIEFLNNIK